jgi:TfoX/Sxy family transcriptional regulator of competence genes
MAEKKSARVWRKSPDDLIAPFHAALPKDLRIEHRKMFGYPCAFVAGNLFAGLHQESVIIRLSKDDRAATLAKDGAQLFEPIPGRPMREYVTVPAGVLGDRSKLAIWLRRGLDYAASLPPKAKKARRAARSASAGAGRSKRG